MKQVEATETWHCPDNGKIMSLTHSLTLTVSHAQRLDNSLIVFEWMLTVADDDVATRPQQVNPCHSFYSSHFLWKADVGVSWQKRGGGRVRCFFFVWALHQEPCHVQHCIFLIDLRWSNFLEVDGLIIACAAVESSQDNFSEFPIKIKEEFHQDVRRRRYHRPCTRQEEAGRWWNGQGETIESILSSRPWILLIFGLPETVYSIIIGRLRWTVSPSSWRHVMWCGVVWVSVAQQLVEIESLCNDL